jgi:hypothetical protein
MVRVESLLRVQKQIVIRTWNRDREKALRLPSQPETPNDGHLAGLLTYASNEPEAPSRGVLSQWHVAQVLSAYSCGAVADSHRASHYQTEETYMRAAGEVKGIGNWINW